jgi:hypothetical protein
MLRKGPDFRIYVRWLRGDLVRTRQNLNPTFDDPESFRVDVKTGIIRANIGDIGNFLNAGGVANSPLRDIALLAEDDHIKLKGTLHKLISMPVELLGSVAATPDNRIQVHVTKLPVLKVPLKGLLGGLNVGVSDLFHPPRESKFLATTSFSTRSSYFRPLIIHGQLTKVRVVTPDIEGVYGNAEEAVTRFEQWRNLLRLNDGTIDFGKLTMHHVDITMVDLSDDAWFDLDLNNYQNQLVNGYTRMTPEAGLQIFMPDLDNLPKNIGKPEHQHGVVKTPQPPSPARDYFKVDVVPSKSTVGLPSIGESSVFRIVVKLLRINGGGRVLLLPGDRSPYRFVNLDWFFVS